MKKLMKFITPYVGVFVIALLFSWIIFSFMIPKMNIRMSDLADQMPGKLLPLSSVDPAEVGKELTDTIVYTLDSSTIDFWVFFDFSRGSVVSDVSSFKDPKGWDLAFRRAKIASNGGGTNKQGLVAVAKLNTTDFDSVTSVPEEAKFIQDTKLSRGADPKNVNLDKWYSYNFMDHYLKSYKSVFIVKTAEGNYAKMQIINYYCKKGNARLTGCYTIKYVYQGDGSKSFVKEGSEPVNQQLKKTG